MKNRLHFFRESIRNIRNTGSVARSSKYLCRAIVRHIHPETAKVVVELGPGDGVITEYILARLAPDARLLVFEINDVFVEKLKHLFPNESRLILIHDSAENMGKYLEQYQIREVDYIISGIPFVMLPEALAISITMKCREWLRPGGEFIQFHYSPILIQLYKRIFGNTKTDFIPLNIPPALVITCVR